MKDTDQIAGPAWVKSSYSAGDGGQCVEVASTDTTVLVRDSKRPAEAIITTGVEEWAAFLRMAARS
ncbi:DUF397 domain-containing protein [Streptomyces sp. CRN 30]|uniref:DUF397 domain-containing protein n=1 Tax=Streptomyces sp. CRN 30 TaxID=3075613 RepID=UPI002A80BF6E|nr:DUF397 domain-containing protein [Streptomyces sp. CRN 30]